jgi:Domain of unknown function (DUF4145)
MQRVLWTDYLTERSAPAWPCPHCHKSTLAFVPQSLSKKETIESKRVRGDETWEPSCINYAFTAWLKCKSSDCGQEVAVIGQGSPETYPTWDEDGTPIEDWRNEFRPLFCWPMPDIIELPSTCPKEVNVELRAAFRLFWTDQAASAGRVRVALERLMDHHKIPKRRKGDKGKYYALKLHARIETFSRTESGAGEKLMALKWLGNTASHQGAVSRDDLLDGFEILECVLADLFEQRAARVAELTRLLTKKHAPAGARRKKTNPI